MTKKEMIAAVAEKTGVTKKEAEAVIEATFATILEEVAANGKSQVAGFGVFEKRVRAARPGRNPQTGETIEIPETASVGFKPAKAFKEAI